MQGQEKERLDRKSMIKEELERVSKLYKMSYYDEKTEVWAILFGIERNMNLPYMKTK